MSESPSNPILRLIVDGPQVGPARIPLSDLADLAGGIQQAVRQIGSVIQTGQSRHAGRHSGVVDTSTRLELVSLEAGSARLEMDFPADIERPLPGFDLGALAVDSLVGGIGLLGSDDASPDDWDEGVYRAVSGFSRTLGRGGVSTITLETRTDRSCRYTSAVGERVKRRLDRERPMKFVDVVGRLMMVDFHAEKRRCRIEPMRGPAVECTYPLDLLNGLREYAQRYVHADGYAELDQDGKIRRLSILRLSPVSTPGTPTAEVVPRSIDALIDKQALQPFTSSQDFVDPELWDGDDEVDSFLRWVDEHRDQAVL